MAHPINDALNRIAGKNAVPCNETCEYWRFPHLDTACELSSVFSVPQGVPCFEYEAKQPNKPLNPTTEKVAVNLPSPLVEKLLVVWLHHLWDAAIKQAETTKEGGDKE